MGLLAKGGDNFDDEFKQVIGNTELLVCPVCGREVPPWQVVCPDDGTPVLAREEIGSQGPAVPAHLLDDLDETPADDPDDDTESRPTPEPAPEPNAGEDDIKWPG